jgi:hypothetical protein
MLGRPLSHCNLTSSTICAVIMSTKLHHDQRHYSLVSPAQTLPFKQILLTIKQPFKGECNGLMPSLLLTSEWYLMLLGRNNQLGLVCTPDSNTHTAIWQLCHPKRGHHSRQHSSLADLRYWAPNSSLPASSLKDLAALLKKYHHWSSHACNCNTLSIFLTKIFQP